MYNCIGYQDELFDLEWKLVQSGDNGRDGPILGVDVKRRRAVQNDADHGRACNGAHVYLYFPIQSYINVRVLFNASNHSRKRILSNY